MWKNKTELTIMSLARESRYKGNFHNQSRGCIPVYSSGNRGPRPGFYNAGKQTKGKRFQLHSGIDNKALQLNVPLLIELFLQKISHVQVPHSAPKNLLPAAGLFADRYPSPR